MYKIYYRFSKCKFLQWSQAINRNTGHLQTLLNTGLEFYSNLVIECRQDLFTCYCYFLSVFSVYIRSRMIISLIQIFSTLIESIWRDYIFAKNSSTIERTLCEDTLRYLKASEIFKCFQERYLFHSLSNELFISLRLLKALQHLLHDKN